MLQFWSVPIYHNKLWIIVLKIDEFFGFLHWHFSEFWIKIFADITTFKRSHTHSNDQLVLVSRFNGTNIIDIF